MQKPLRIKCRRSWIWLAMLMSFNGQIPVKAADQNKTLLVDTADLFQYPDHFIGKTIGVTASVLCLDRDHCVLQNTLSPATFLRFDTKQMASINKLRLARECYQISCSELIIGVWTHHSFKATASYDVKLPSLQNSDNHQSNKLNLRQIPFLQSEKTIFGSCKNTSICSSYKEGQWISLLQYKIVG